MKSNIETPKKLPENIRCQSCGNTSFKTKVTTFPFPTPFGPTIDVKKVPVQECLKCHEVIPTPEGRLKLARCLSSFMSIPNH